MKRIKAMNGYTIYEVTARDEKQGNGTAGEFAIYFSSDIRDYGVAYSTPEFDGVETLEQAVELIEGEGNYAKARELCEKESTAVTFEDIEAMQERLSRLDADRAQEVEAGNMDIDEAEEEQTDEEKEHRAYTAIMDVLKSMDAGELVSVWNEYCNLNNRFDDLVYDMADFNDVYYNVEPEEIARRCFYGHDEYGDESSFNPNRAWFYFNGYGNPVSVEYLGWNNYADKFMGDCIDADELAIWAASHQDGLYNDDITEAIESVYGEV